MLYYVKERKIAMKNRNGRAIIISCVDWYDQRMKYIEQYLNGCDFETAIVLSDFNHYSKKTDKRWSGRNNVRYIHVVPYKKNISLKRIFSHWLFSKKVCTIIKNSDPALVYCLIPPNSLVKDLGKLKKKMKFRLVFDVIDMWPESFPKGNTNLLPFLIWKQMRDNYINVAEDIVLECAYYKKNLRRIVNVKKMHVFQLVKPSLKEMKYEIESKEKIYLAYLGSINSLIDVDNVLVVLKRLLKIKPVVLKIVGDGELKDEFIARVNSIGVETEYFGKIFDDEKKYEILGKCHFGLNIYKVNTNIGLTGKSVDYFQMGLPILNSIPGDTEELVKKYGIGINLKDITEQELSVYINDIEKNKRKVNKIFDRFFDEKNIGKVLAFLIEF